MRRCVRVCASPSVLIVAGCAVARVAVLGRFPALACAAYRGRSCGLVVRGDVVVVMSLWFLSWVVRAVLVAALHSCDPARVVTLVGESVPDRIVASRSEWW